MIPLKERSVEKIHLSFDEWNVWYHSNEQDEKSRNVIGGGVLYPYLKMYTTLKMPCVEACL